MDSMFSRELEIKQGISKDRSRTLSPELKTNNLILTPDESMTLNSIQLK